MAELEEAAVGPKVQGLEQGGPVVKPNKARGCRDVGSPVLYWLSGHQVFERVVCWDKYVAGICQKDSWFKQTVRDGSISNKDS